LEPITTPKEAGHRGLSLRVKLAGLFAAFALLGSLVLIAAFYSVARRETIKAFEDWGLPAARERARALAATLKAGDASQIRAAAEAAAADLPHVLYVAIRDEKGAVALVHFKRPDASAIAEELPPRESGQEARMLEPFSLAGLEVLPLMAPLPFAGPESAGGALKPSGSLELGFELDAPLKASAVRSRFSLALWPLGILASFGAALWLTRLLLAPLQRLAQAASGIAGGNLAQVIEVDGDDEIAALARSFQTMTIGLRSMIADLRASAGEVEREASNILSTATQQSAMSNEQASAINETSTTVTEIAQTSKQATEHADSVIKVAQRSEDLTRDGQKTVEEAMAGMEKLADQVKAIALSITELSERTMQIGDIIATVKELAEQSNLLALNASIEAAKAGDHGRGFAVVAMEMRNLAEQSKVAAGEVRAILSEVQKGTKGAVSATEEGSKRAHSAIELARGAGTAIDGLAEVIRDSSAAARQIASNTRQQTIGVEQIVSAITELSAAMSDALEGTRRIEKVAGNLTTVSRHLTDLVSRYRV
jgi:methyl-accepting chemotaxis protein